MGRSILAVVTGYGVMAVAIMVLFAAWFRSPDQIPTLGFMVFAVWYAFVFAVLGEYVCGLISRRAALRYAGWLTSRSSQASDARPIH